MTLEMNDKGNCAEINLCYTCFPDRALSLLTFSFENISLRALILMNEFLVWDATARWLCNFLLPF